MYLDEFSKMICKDLPKGSTCIYGSVGPQYLCVLVPVDGQILLIGQFIYTYWYRGYWRERCYEHLLSEFITAVKKCYDEQIAGTCNTIPSIHYDDSVLKVNLSEAAYKTYKA